MDENFPNLPQDITNLRGSVNLNKINSKKFTLRLVIIRLLKTKQNNKKSKAAIEKCYIIREQQFE